MNHPSSISQRLHESLGQIIAATSPGDRLPSEPVLARRLSVSRATLREAMRTFETQGLIRRRQGSGTFVTPPTSIIDSGLEVLESIETLAQRINLPVTIASLHVDSRPPLPDEAQGLGIPAEKKIIHVSRVILAEGRPAAYLIDILPEDILKPENLNHGFTGSVLDFLLHRGIPQLVYSRTEINATTATSEIAHLLGIQRGDVLLQFIATLYTTDNLVVDYSFSYFLPGYFCFHVVRRVGGGIN